MQAAPDAGSLPVVQPWPADHAAAVAQFQGWNADTQDIDDAVEGLLIAREAALLWRRFTDGISGSMRCHNVAEVSLQQAMPPILPSTNLCLARFFDKSKYLLPKIQEKNISLIRPAVHQT